MRRKDVPQDGGLFGEMKEVCYAVDDEGRYTLVESSGWEPANIANLQAWESIDAEIAVVLRKIRDGELSPLAYHMARHQMDPRLLAGYAGLFAWQVRRHMKPNAFRRLRPETATRYAEIFGIRPEELSRVPDPPGDRS